MSFDSMVSTQPPVTVLRSADPHLSNDAALANPSAFSAVATIRGRLVLASGTQVAMWASLGITADYQLDTQSIDIQNGDIVQYTDPRMGLRTFRVKGSRGQWMGQGSIASFLKYPVQEVTRT